MHPPEAKVSDRDNWSRHWFGIRGCGAREPGSANASQAVAQADSVGRREVALLLDIGSGQGDFLAMVVQSGVVRRCVGFELSEVGVSISRAKVPTATFHRVDLFAPPAEISYLENEADVVVCSEVIEHVDDTVGFCRLIRSYLKFGGRLLVTVPAGPMSAFVLYRASASLRPHLYHAGT
jgi:2-polyprenyl-3-methyl-5-hydroxy-6-metoxy-1,4-benzoquinol methylase